MKNLYLPLAALWLLLATGCSKSVDAPVPDSPPSGAVPANSFVRHTIPAGAHYSDQSNYRPLETSLLRFAVRFDSSAVYRSRLPENQYDINKLYGFSDNGMDHHQFSARMGWRWSDGALRLFAYVYNEGVRESEELATVAIGEEIVCSIGVREKEYVFSVNGQQRVLPRKSATVLARGYRLYPYFGGDEAAPHEVRIWVRDL